MPSIFAPQTPATNDTGAVTLGFQGAPNVLYDRTMVGSTAYTISTTGTTGGETMSVTLRGAYAYSFASSVGINWAGGLAPTPSSLSGVFDRLKFEVLQDGSLLGIRQATAASIPITAPSHYLNVNGQNQNASAATTAANDGSDSFLSIMVWLNLTSTYTPSNFAPLVSRWVPNSNTTSNTEYTFGISTNGILLFLCIDATGQYRELLSTVGISSSLANTAGIWLRFDYNAGLSTVNGLSAGAGIFYTSVGGATPNWVQLGSAPSGGMQTGLNHLGSGSGAIIFGDNHDNSWSTNTCHMYEAIVKNSTTVLANPNFQAQATMASGGSFVDTAATPNTITLNTNIV
jgi:hypothetical protein